LAQDITVFNSVVNHPNKATSKSGMMRGIFSSCAIIALGFALAEDSASDQSLRAVKATPAQHQSAVLRPETPTRALRICNAFVNKQPLKVRCLRTAEDMGTLAYKECKDHQLPLQEGDQIQFKSDTADVGTFAVAGLPRSPVTLLLIVSNKKGHGSMAAFKSHAFADGADGTAQVAVVDTYQGVNITDVSVRIRDEVQKTGDEASLGEELPLNSVVAVSPGNYRVELAGGDGKPVSFTSLDAQAKVSYVVMRVGGEDEGSPQEVVVFPQMSSAARVGTFLAMFLSVAFLLH